MFGRFDASDPLRVVGLAACPASPNETTTRMSHSSLMWGSESNAGAAGEGLRFNPIAFPDGRIPARNWQPGKKPSHSVSKKRITSLY